MSLSLYMDEHVPAAITAALRERGVDVLTVQEDGRSGDADDALLARAVSSDRIMFSQDTDLLRLAAEKQRNGEKFAGVIYAHQSSVSIGTCIDDLELIAKACAPEELEMLVQYLPLR